MRINMSEQNRNQDFELLWIKLAVKWRQLIEFFKVAWQFYRNPRFCKIDLSLFILYFGESPFIISKRFLTSRGDDNLYSYGETPLTSLKKISKECQIHSSDTVFELGCGRGRTSFWLNSFIKCNVVGIDFVPEFIQKANLIKERFGLNGVRFLLQDMFEANIQNATVVYLYGTCLNDTQIMQLIEKFKTLPPGTKIITVSYPLTDYSSDFEVMNRFTVPYTWGEADIYLQMKK